MLARAGLEGGRAFLLTASTGSTGLWIGKASLRRVLLYLVRKEKCVGYRRVRKGKHPFVLR